MALAGLDLAAKEEEWFILTHWPVHRGMQPASDISNWNRCLPDMSIRELLFHSTWDKPWAACVAKMSTMDLVVAHNAHGHDRTNGSFSRAEE